MQRNIKKVESSMDGRKLKIGVVVSKFNPDITSRMFRSALEVLKKNKVKKENIKIVYAPGSFEIPLACQKLTLAKKYDALIAIGCLIKGETDHYHYIADAVSKGIMDVSLKYNVPIGFSVITVNNLKQAKNRSGKKKNKGAEGAQAVLEMINLK